MDAGAFDRASVMLPGILVDSHEGAPAATDEILELMWQSAQWPGNPLPITANRSDTIEWSVKWAW
jgi:hypothetical protein